MEEAASIIIHLDCYDAIKCLPDELAGVLFKSILCYGATGELPKIDDKSLLALFNMFKAQRDRDTLGGKVLRYAKVVVGA